jgi:hypothetical protein
MVKSLASVRLFSVWLLLLLLSMLLLPCQCQAIEEEEHTPPFYDPEEVWSSWYIWDLYWWLDCLEEHHSDDNPEAWPVHSPATWHLLRHAYRETVGDDQSSLPPEEEDWDQQDGGASDGFRVPVRVVKTEDRGRGNYVRQMVPEGTLVWSSKYTAQFTTGEQYRSFLRRIPPALACDVLVWAYTRWTTVYGTNSVICLDLDIGSFTNEANNDAEWNMDLGNGKQRTFHNTGCKLEFYADRDIPAGEELAIDYAFSARAPGWMDLGLLDEKNHDHYLWPQHDEYDDEQEEEEAMYERMLGPAKEVEAGSCSIPGADQAYCWPAPPKLKR